MSSTDQQVVKWYTRARKFPQLIGRTHDGTRLWGGPYTITQVVAAGVLMLIGVRTTSLWAHYGLLGNGALLLGVTYGLVLLLGKIPLGARNPVAIAAGTWRALSAPRTGRMAGRPVRLRPPHRVHHRITVLLPAAVTPTAPTAPSAGAAAIASTAPAAAAAPAQSPTTGPPKQNTRRHRPRPSSGRHPAAPNPIPHPPSPPVPPATPSAPRPTPGPAAPAGTPAPTGEPTRTGRPALTGLQALLACTGPPDPAQPVPTLTRRS